MSRERYDSEEIKCLLEVERMARYVDQDASQIGELGSALRALTECRERLAKEYAANRPCPVCKRPGMLPLGGPCVFCEFPY